MKQQRNPKPITDAMVKIRSWAWTMHRAVTPSQRRNKVLAMVAAEVAMGKPSYHSASGHTIAPILQFLEEQGIPYILECTILPNKGYRIQAMPKAEDLIPEQDFPKDKSLTTTH